MRDIITLPVFTFPRLVVLDVDVRHGQDGTVTLTVQADGQAVFSIVTDGFGLSDLARAVEDQYLWDGGASMWPEGHGLYYDLAANDPGPVDWDDFDFGAYYDDDETDPYGERYDLLAEEDEERAESEGWGERFARAFDIALW